MEGQRSDGSMPREEIGLDGEPYVVWEPSSPPPMSEPYGAQAFTPAPPSLSGPDAAPPYVRAGAPGQSETDPVRNPLSAMEQVAELPRVSSEHNDYGWFSLGLAVGAVVLVAVGFAVHSDVGAAAISLLSAAAAAYYGVRSHNASLRGFATNAWAGRTGIALAIVSAIGSFVLVDVSFTHAFSL